MSFYAFLHTFLSLPPSFQLLFDSSLLGNPCISHSEPLTASLWNGLSPVSVVVGVFVVHFVEINVCKMENRLDPFDI